MVSCKILFAREARQAIQSLRAFADASLGKGLKDNDAFAFLRPDDLHAFLTMIADQLETSVDGLIDTIPSLRLCK